MPLPAMEASLGPRAPDVSPGPQSYFLQSQLRHPSPSVIRTRPVRAPGVAAARRPSPQHQHPDPAGAPRHAWELSGAGEALGADVQGMLLRAPPRLPSSGLPEGLPPRQPQPLYTIDAHASQRSVPPPTETARVDHALLYGAGDAPAPPPSPRERAQDAFSSDGAVFGRPLSGVQRRDQRAAAEQLTVTSVYSDQGATVPILRGAGEESPGRARGPAAVESFSMAPTLQAPAGEREHSRRLSAPDNPVEPRATDAPPGSQQLPAAAADPEVRAAEPRGRPQYTGALARASPPGARPGAPPGVAPSTGLEERIRELISETDAFRAWLDSGVPPPPPPPRTSGHAASLTPY